MITSVRHNYSYVKGIVPQTPCGSARFIVWVFSLEGLCRMVLRCSIAGVAVAYVYHGYCIARITAVI